MAIAEERLGFFNARLVQRMNEVSVSATQLAKSTHLTYEHIRKLMMGHCLPSQSALERMCAALAVNRRDMAQRVAKDRVLFKFGDATWRFWGINPQAGPLYILFPLLRPEQQDLMRLWIAAMVKVKKQKKISGTTERKEPKKSQNS